MATYATVNPATGETLKEFPTLDSQGVEDALARSHAAFSTWRAVSPAERSAVLSKVAGAYSERQDELAQMIALEMGKPVRQAVGEVQLSGDDLPVVRRPRTRRCSRTSSSTCRARTSPSYASCPIGLAHR